MFQDIKVSEDLNVQFRSQTTKHDAINIKILNAGAWAARGERVSVSLPIGKFRLIQIKFLLIVFFYSRT